MNLFESKSFSSNPLTLDILIVASNFKFLYPIRKITNNSLIVVDNYSKFSRCVLSFLSENIIRMGSFWGKDIIAVLKNNLSWE